MMNEEEIGKSGEHVMAEENREKTREMEGIGEPVLSQEALEEERQHFQKIAGSFLSYQSVYLQPVTRYYLF